MIFEKEISFVKKYIDILQQLFETFHILREIYWGGGEWIGSSWLRIGTGGWHLCML
jgi:hypothetical protein